MFCTNEKKDVIVCLMIKEDIFSRITSLFPSQQLLCCSEPHFWPTMATSTKSYDIVLFGVTGFTGKRKKIRQRDHNQWMHWHFLLEDSSRKGNSFFLKPEALQGKGFTVQFSVSHFVLIIVFISSRENLQLPPNTCSKNAKLICQTSDGHVPPETWPRRKAFYKRCRKR